CVRYRTEDDPALVFLLVHGGKGNVLPFYIMRDKVSRRQFRSVMASQRARETLDRLAEKYPWTVKREWEKEPDQLPVTLVTLMEAHCFAASVGGKLPTEPQWRKAAGASDDDRRGPFDGGWERGGIPVGREEPAPVGESRADKSVYRCRDMAGNGKEWTRPDARTDGTDPLTEPRNEKEREPFAQIGQSFRKKEPFV